MDPDLVKFLKARKLFASLDEKKLQKIVLKFSKIELLQGKILFKQNDPSDSVYILISGKLSALLHTDENRPQIVGTIEVGETVGELGVLAKEPRTLTIKAAQDSELLKISNKDFLALCYRYPAILFETIHPLIIRSQTIIQKLTLKNAIKYLTFIPANEQTMPEYFVKKLTEHAKRYSSLIIFSDFDPELKKLSASELREQIKEIKHHKKASQKMVFFLKNTTSPLAKIGLHSTDLLYIIGESTQEPMLDPAILDFINHHSHLKTNPELILLHPPQTKAPVHTQYWLQLTSFNMHYHMLIDKNAHYHRLLRFIRGKAVGVVLGGGGTRGFAHIGAMKALREQRIPIDFIGGTSVGALIAAAYALNESIDATYDLFTKIVQTSTGSTSWRSLTWPVISIFNAKRFTEAQMAAFQTIQAEDLWLPFFCISSNLATSTEEVHRSGLLWELTRASTSIPGIVPPMVLNYELHLDGGLFNNLPVDVMRKYLGKRGKIIAIELNNAIPAYHKYHFPPILTFKQIILNKLGLTHESYKFPRFIDTFLRGLLVGSSSKTKLNGLQANVLVKINLNKFRLLNTNLKQGSKMFEMGYLETMLRIQQLKNNQLT